MQTRIKQERLEAWQEAQRGVMVDAAAALAAFDKARGPPGRPRKRRGTLVCLSHK